MRKISVLTFVTMDGIMQSPGAPEEDPSGGFTYGGWLPPYFDEMLGAEMGAQMETKPFDLLLGRKTFEIFASYWPHHVDEGPGINNATKYVVSNTMTSHDWKPSVFIGGDVVNGIKKIKQEAGYDIQVHGSATLIQTLLKHDLVDELWLKIFPVTVGTGKRLFGDGVVPAAFKVTASKVTPAGVIIVNYARDGALKIGAVPA